MWRNDFQFPSYSSLSCSANHLAPLFNDTAAANYLCAQFDSISKGLADTTYFLFSPCSAPAPSEPRTP
ncbi:hypothetical protein JHK82_057141 [Glycine max]|nr:hypothetical protein JHK82_057141 [Glycine max]